MNPTPLCDKCMDCEKLRISPLMRCADCHDKYESILANPPKGGTGENGPAANCSNCLHPLDTPRQLVEGGCVYCEAQGVPADTAKRDDCGVRFDLIPGDVLREVAEVFAVGAKRYGDYNWSKSRLSGEHGPVNHALKHLNLYNAGIPDEDGPDMKIHLKHAIVNLMFELYYELHPEQYDQPS